MNITVNMKESSDADVCKPHQSPQRAPRRRPSLCDPLLGNTLSTIWESNPSLFVQTSSDISLLSSDISDSESSSSSDASSSSFESAEETHGYKWKEVNIEFDSDNEEEDPAAATTTSTESNSPSDKQPKVSSSFEQTSRHQEVKTKQHKKLSHGVLLKGFVRSLALLHSKKKKGGTKVPVCDDVLSKAEHKKKNWAQ